jgi:hypothetical protein
MVGTRELVIISLVGLCKMYRTHSWQDTWFGESFIKMYIFLLTPSAVLSRAHVTRGKVSVIIANAVYRNCAIIAYGTC